MPKYQWRRAYELSVPEIDGDHRIMLELVNVIADAALTGDKQRCGIYIDRIIKFALLHFSREEKLLESWGYDQIAVHRDYHIKMHDGAVRNFARLDTISTNDELALLCEGLIDFLIDDVIRGDLNLKSFLDYRGITIQSDDAIPNS